MQRCIFLHFYIKYKSLVKVIMRKLQFVSTGLLCNPHANKEKSHRLITFAGDFPCQWHCIVSLRNNLNMKQTCFFPLTFMVYNSLSDDQLQLTEWRFETPQSTFSAGCWTFILFLFHFILFYSPLLCQKQSLSTHYIP